MYCEDDLLPLSALQHYIFCPRQCALIHLERMWAENWLTAKGRVMHERVHQEKSEHRRKIRTEFALDLRSLRLGLVGKADVVEFNWEEALEIWRPFPVEYKRGKQKADSCDEVQLCAQALCLEEMLSVAVPRGALFYGKEQRRIEIEFDQALREETTKTAAALHALIRLGKTPAPVYEKKCDSCSLLELCLPKVIEKRNTVENYFLRMVEP